jgi:hypothetical protein
VSICAVPKIGNSFSFDHFGSSGQSGQFFFANPIGGFNDCLFFPNFFWKILAFGDVVMV